MSAPTVTTHRGRGPVTFGVYDTTNGQSAHGYLTSQRKVTCAIAEMQLTPVSTSKDVTEGCSGLDRVIDKKPRSQKMQVKLTLRQFSRLEFAMAYFGVSADVLSGTVTSEAFATLAVGDTFHTKHPGISSLVMKDSAGSPATLTLDTHYALDSAAHGQGRILSLGAFTQPFKADYSYAAYSTLLPLAQTSVRRGLIFDGVNTDNANATERIWIPHIDWEPNGYNWTAADDEPLTLTGEALYLEALAGVSGWGPYMRIDGLPTT